MIVCTVFGIKGANTFGICYMPIGDMQGFAVSVYVSHTVYRVKHAHVLIVFVVLLLLYDQFLSVYCRHWYDILDKVLFWAKWYLIVACIDYYLGYSLFLSSIIRCSDVGFSFWRECDHLSIIICYATDTNLVLSRDRIMWGDIVFFLHHSDVIMNAMASRVLIVSWSVCSVVDQRKHQSSASLAFVRGIHRWPINSPHKEPVTRKMFPFDDVIMDYQCWPSFGIPLGWRFIIVNIC